MKEFTTPLLQSLSILLKLPATSAVDESTLATNLQRWCEERLMQDWVILRNCLNSSDEDLALLLHHLLTQSDEIFSAPCEKFKEILFRIQWEQNSFQAVVHPVLQSLGGNFLSTLRSSTLDTQQEREKVNRVQMNQTCFYTLLTETPPEAGAGQEATVPSLLDDGNETKTDPAAGPPTLLDPSSMDSSLWGYRKRITINDFKQQFALNSLNAELCPFIQTVLHNESSLSSVNILIPIFQWHHYLFKTFPSRSLSREDALRLTNLDAVKMTTTSTADYNTAMELMNAFIAAFNSSFCDVENIFECRANPLRYTLKMSPNTPLVFSLPSLPSPGGEASEGICTIALIEMLRGRQNNLLDLLSDQPQLKGGGPNDLQELCPTMKITQSTPPSILSRILCSYDPSRDLLPLLFGYSLHLTDASHSIQFDYQRINASLGKMLRVGKQKLALQLMLYEYAGEMCHSGTLTTLNRILPQRELPVGMEEMIKGELARHAALPELLKLFETAFRFLTSPSMSSASATASHPNSFEEEKSPMGSSAAACETPSSSSTFECLSVDAFFLTTLSLSPALWDEISIPILRNNYLTLSHLLHIHSLLQAALGIDPLEKLDQKYRKELSPAEIQMLRSLHPQSRGGSSQHQGSAGPRSVINLPQLVRLLHGVMVESLVENVSVNEKISLKEEFLIYLDEFLELEGFQELFPAELRLESIWATHRHLSQLTSSASPQLGAH
jgi:hypothetical protein